MGDKNDCNQSSKSSDSKDKTENSKKYNFYRKPSIKKKVPEVKHTKTSMKRMLKANPLLKYEKEGIPLPCASQERNKDQAAPCGSKNPKNNSSKPCGIVRLAGNVPNPNARHMTLNQRLSSSDFKSTNTILSSTVLDDEVFTNGDRAISKKKPTENSKTASRMSVLKVVRKPLRRSFSAQHLDRKAGNPKIQVVPIEDQKQEVRSLENISIAVPSIPHHNISTISEVSHEGALLFKTPSAYERRSMFKYTPRSTNISRRSIYHPSSDLPSLEDLQKRLNDWLIKRGKSISLFTHLKRYQSPDEENKENIEVDPYMDRGSYEDLRIPKTEDNASKEKTGDLDNENLAKAALVDLNNLIGEGYPVKQSEAWLELIKSKYKKLSEEPEYWECRAAIEQSRGNITDAVEYYRTAIVQGAEIKDVDKSLDILLQKFSLLNISTDEVERNSRERTRIVQDARNVFKSSIIKFAVQEKKLKKNESTETKLIVTPVRRSTRVSRSAYTSTPGVKECSTLRELHSPEWANIDFHNNKGFV
ncbi:hypothetical protein JTB14_030712 [Gonioctena quinquepunctata]|nr:hypothetical protein JTB14_030712 [Gonioctena quinquepunctata]